MRQPRETPHRRSYAAPCCGMGRERERKVENSRTGTDSLIRRGGKGKEKETATTTQNLTVTTTARTNKASAAQYNCSSPAEQCPASSKERQPLQPSPHFIFSMILYGMEHPFISSIPCVLVLSSASNLCPLPVSLLSEQQQKLKSPWLCSTAELRLKLLYVINTVFLLNPKQSKHRIKQN